MPDNKDYAAWTLDALLAEEKRMKRNNTVSAFFIGFLAGIMLYGTVKKGIGFLHIFIPALLIAGVYRNSQKIKQNLAQVKAAINAKEAS
jgi:hypothetical protein